MKKAFSADIYILHKEKQLCDLLSAEAEFCGYKTIVSTPKNYESVKIPPVRLIICDITAKDCIDESVTTPIIWVQDRAIDENQDDNFLVRPFLLSKYRETLRRLTDGQGAERMTADVLPYIPVGGKQAVFCGKSIEITPNEEKLLTALLEKNGEPISREELAERLGETNSNTVDVYICFLRRKFSAVSPTKIIHSVRGFGYRIGI